VKPRGKNWRDGKGFTLNVLFNQLAGDPRADSGARGLSNALSMDLNAYGVVFAAIDPTPEIEAAGRAMPKDARLVGGPPMPEPGAGGSNTRSAPAQPNPPADGFRFLSGIPMADRQFTGTAKQFETALPALVNRAVSAGGLQAHNYQPEIVSIIDQVRKCEEITAEMVASVNGRIGGLRVPYSLCNGRPYVQVEVFGTMNPRKRRILLSVGTRSGEWGKNHGLVVNVSFARMIGDPPAVGEDANNSEYGIVQATIP
jgi:hypothetical protein